MVINALTLIVRAAIELLQFSLEGRLGLSLEPPGFQVQTIFSGKHWLLPRKGFFKILFTVAQILVLFPQDQAKHTPGPLSN